MNPLDAYLLGKKDGKEEYEEKVREAVSKFQLRHNSMGKNSFESHEINDWILDLEKELGL